MFILVKQELFKLLHKKSTWILTLALLIIQVMAGFNTKGNPHSGYFNYDYLGLPLIILFLIASSATIMSNEFEYGTIKELLYRRYSRGQVLSSKWLTIFFYSLY